jgi:hypothetical protein
MYKNFQVTFMKSFSSRVFLKYQKFIEIPLQILVWFKWNFSEFFFNIQWFLHCRLKHYETNLVHPT